MKRLSPTEQLGQRVRELRLLRGWPQEDLGVQCNLDRTYVSGIERGVRNPTLTVISALAAGLRVSVAELFLDTAGS